MTIKPSAENGPGLDWFKSSYSNSSNGNDCVEVAWTKSSYSSSSEGDDCVEVASSPSCPTVHIRDSKNPDGPRLTVGPAAWAGFLVYASE
ncbi:DUF397 domain-containing protein [Streptomyces sp. NBC_00259]|uniref:DUF397 domain-containing protein n=1 Tax=Streptomyces sp. NBC_00259 TaxID=2903643 RepID=UPI002E2B44E4|nr:DUF397 domain-containing protein [Streptomyces sp. NBC_00259]